MSYFSNTPAYFVTAEEEVPPPADRLFVLVRTRFQRGKFRDLSTLLRRDRHNYHPVRYDRALRLRDNTLLRGVAVDHAGEVLSVIRQARREAYYLAEHPDPAVRTRYRGALLGESYQVMVERSSLSYVPEGMIGADKLPALQLRTYAYPPEARVGVHHYLRALRHHYSEIGSRVPYSVWMPETGPDVNTFTLVARGASVAALSKLDDVDVARTSSAATSRFARRFAELGLDFKGEMAATAVPSLVR